MNRSSRMPMWSFRQLNLIAGLLVLSIAPVAAQERYKTPEDAAAALLAATKAGSSQEMLKVLGRKADDIIESGDDVEDADTRKQFVAAYEAKHTITLEGDKKAVLVIGKDDFSFPIPLVRSGWGWEFDPAAGRIEILYRRIGRNELDAIQTCLAFVDAQNDYAEKDRGAGRGVYASKIVSSRGKKDGLFWQDDKDPSPLGEFAAQASADGYTASDGRQPYHGYYYKILTRQGDHAPGGELDYIVKGKMIGGFALVAYPAEYGNSGVMTFLVSHAGTVYQKDLGPRTEILARSMSVFNPDQTWKKVPPEK